MTDASRNEVARWERLVLRATRLGWPLPLLIDILSGAHFVVRRGRLWVEPG